MANRVTNPNLFASLPPLWLLSSLDQNSGFFQSAFNDSSLGYVNGIPIDTGSANLYTIALPFGTPSAYQDGMSCAFIPSNTNTGTSTLTVTPLGSSAVLNPAGIALQGGEIAANRATLVTYKSAAPTGFRIVGPCPLSLNTTTGSSTLSIECAGYTSIDAVVTFTNTLGITITFAHLAQGVPVFLNVTNSSGGAHGVAFAATNPAGTAFTNIVAVPSGTTNGATGVDMINTGVILTNGLAMTFTGGAIAPLVANFAK